MDQPAHFPLLISSQNNNSNYDQYNREKLRTSEKRNFVNWRSGVRISINPGAPCKIDPRVLHPAQKIVQIDFLL